MYEREQGKSCPTEILEALKEFNAEGRPVWKPMHMQPIYRMNGFVGHDREGTGSACKDVSMDIFDRGLCLPSDIKMTAGEQEKVIEIVKRCFG